MILFDHVFQEPLDIFDKLPKYQILNRVFLTQNELSIFLEGPGTSQKTCSLKQTNHPELRTLLPAPPKGRYAACLMQEVTRGATR